MATERRFKTSLREWTGVRDVGESQDVFNSQRSLYAADDPDRWPNNYGPLSFGGWQRVTRENADKVFHSTLRPDPKRDWDDPVPTQQWKR